jgi:ABC-type glycerol-3-phosphate transport system substrate-binding protein
MVKGLSFAIASEVDTRAIAALDFVRWMLLPENQAEIIEKTGVFPLSNETIELVNNDLSLYPIWRDSLQYLPYAQPEPVFEEWYAMEKVIEDVGWQIIQFTMQPEKIEGVLTDAERILGDAKEPGE